MLKRVFEFRVPAIVCALSVLVCALISRPFADMGIGDETPYIFMARTLASTGHVVYNGWPAAMLGWQLYLGAAFIKLLGFSFTTVRMAILLVAMVVAFVLQRTLVRLNINERNATIGTLAFVLFPLYLMLSVTFMSDMCGLFAIVVCLYGCIRALQSSTERSTIAWLCFAIAANAIFGTARQIAWLGILVMVPSTLWLLRTRRRVVIVGLAATLVGALFLLTCLHWFARQPYIQQEHLLPRTFPVAHIFKEFFQVFLDVPFQLLPIFVLFLPQIFKSRTRVITIISGLIFIYLFLAISPHFASHRLVLLEPVDRDGLGFNGKGVFPYPMLQGHLPQAISRGMQIVITAASFGSLLGMILALRRLRIPSFPDKASAHASWKQLSVILAPFTIAYLLLLIPRAATSGIYDRYTLVLLMVAIPFLVRFYQDRIQPRLPLTSALLVGVMAVCSIATTHNTFALDRARIVMAAELHSQGILDTSIDNGWEYNLGVELQHADHINDFRIAYPIDAYHRTSPSTPGCPMAGYDDVPHIQPIYSVSFDPNACYGPAPFARVAYSRWFAHQPGFLYVVRAIPGQR